MQGKINIKLVPKTKIEKFKDGDMYWTLDKFYSNKTFLNIAVGGRGIGKTFSIKRRMIDNFINDKKRFVYIRYFDSELNPDDFFSKITNYYPDNEFGYSGKRPGEPVKLYIDGECAGYMVAIKTAYKAKSTDFIDVDTIHFDEFLAPVTTQGVPEHAPTVLMELLETIIRNTDDSKIRVFLTSNATALDNEFFDFFHIPIEELKEIKGNCIKLNELVSFEYCLTTEEFIQAKEKTNLGKLFKMTGHWNYAIDNDFIEGVLPEILKGDEKIAYKKGYGICIKYDDGFLIISQSNFKYKYMAEYLKELPKQLGNGYKRITFDLGLSDKIFTFEEKTKTDELRDRIYDALCTNQVRFNSQTSFTKCLNWFKLVTKW